MEQRSVQGDNGVGWEGPRSVQGDNSVGWGRHSSMQGDKRLDELKGKRDSLKFTQRDFKKYCLT